MKDTVLTGISEVEVIFNITSDVVVLFVLYPMCVCLLIIPDENSKQHNHSYLPDKADGRKTNTHIGVLGPAKEIPHNVTKVPHVDDSADDAQLGSLSLSLLSPALCCHCQQHLTRYLWRSGEVCPTWKLTHRGWEHVHASR